jgi:hypothetical protein
MSGQSHASRAWFAGSGDEHSVSYTLTLSNNAGQVRLSTRAAPAAAVEARIQPIAMRALEIH